MLRQSNILAPETATSQKDFDLSRSVQMASPITDDGAMGQPPFVGWREGIHQLIFALFLAQLALVLGQPFLPRNYFSEAGWPTGVLLFLAAATLLASLARHLPAQNVILAAAIIATIGTAVTKLGVLAGIGRLPVPEPLWAVPMVWIIFVLSSRGVARLLLKRWRTKPNYGYWVIGLTAALTAWLNFGLGRFVAASSHGASLIGFLGWMLAALLMIAFATPSLIPKKPVPPPPPDFHPLIIWVLLNLLFATACV
jgi:hypothetical protein